MPLLKVTIPTREKRCSASIMTDGFPRWNSTKSNFTNGQNIVTAMLHLERHTAIFAVIVAVNELLSRFNVLRLSAYAIGFSEGFIPIHKNKPYTMPEGKLFEKGDTIQ